MATTYRAGQNVIFDEAPAVILEATAAGSLKISRFPGMSSYIFDIHSKLRPLTEDDEPTSVFAERFAEIRAYYGLGV